MRFTPGELKVMRLLWQQGELTPPRLLELFPEPIKDPALRSYLKILVDKGHVERRRVGKAYAYRAVTPKTSAFGEMVRELAETFCEGSLRSLMLNLAREEKLTEDDVKEIRQAAGLSSDAKKPANKGARS